MTWPRAADVCGSSTAPRSSSSPVAIASMSCRPYGGGRFGIFSTSPLVPLPLPTWDVRRFGVVDEIPLDARAQPAEVDTRAPVVPDDVVGDHRVGAEPGVDALSPIVVHVIGE